MSRIRGRDTGPERLVRSLLHGMGYRFRLQGRSLPGRPDIVFAGRRKAIFVHGCFWHSHDGCQLASKPRSNNGYWSEKLARNRERDIVHLQALSDLGYDVLTVWECKTRDDVRLREAVAAFFAGLPSRGAGARTHIVTQKKEEALAPTPVATKRSVFDDVDK